MDETKIKVEDVKDQIEALKEAFGVDKDIDLTKALNISYSAIDAWKRRGKVPTKYDKFIQNVDRVNKTEKKEDSNNIDIFHYDNVLASAGGGAYAIDENKKSVMSFDTEFLKARLGITNHRNMHTISAFGDSMQPTINNGDLLFVLPFENEQSSIKDGAIYVLNCDSSVFVKRVNLNPVKKTITLLSDNKEYEPIVIEGDELNSCNIIGRVVLYMGMA